MISITGRLANFSSAPATNVNFKMNTAAPISSLCGSRRKEALTVSRLERSTPLTVQPLQRSDTGNRFNASTLQRFNVILSLATLALIWLPFLAAAQTISPASLPLYFQANNDQTEFLSSGNGCQFTIAASGVRMALRESGARAATAQMRFIGENGGAQIHGGGEMIGKINYLIGNDSSKWHTGLSTFGNVQVTELYPGINLV